MISKKLTSTKHNLFNRFCQTKPPLADQKYFALFYKYKYGGEELRQKRAPLRESHLDLVKKTPELKMGGAFGDLKGI